jgi:hypothetical protein
VIAAIVIPPRALPLRILPVLMLPTRRRELCTRVLKRCRRADQKTCASTCSAACESRPRDLARDMLCCQWPSVQNFQNANAMPPMPHVLVHRSQRSRAQQHEMLTAWKAAMETSEAIQFTAAREKTKEKECTLPMDMECGCKTKREKEAKEALALAQAEAKKTAQEAAQRIQSRAVAKRDVAIVNSSSVHVTSTAPAAVPTSFHRRHLPLDCIAFSSPDGRKLFVEALNAPTNYMHIYFPLAEQFITQAEPAYCGLSTLAMCLNAMQVDPGRLWKGAWRWFSEELFDCCTSLSVAKEKGISMAEFICLARCNGVLTDDHPADASLSLDQFRAIVQKSCATNNEIVVLNYSRKVLGQTGDGHFSPIGGYHAERDMGTFCSRHGFSLSSI